MKARSTTDLLIIMVAGTICGAVLISVMAVGLIELFQPAADTGAAAAALGSVLNTLVGLLAGYLAGRTQRARQEAEAHVDRQEDVVDEA